jgi:hypothetical protein
MLTLLQAQQAASQSIMLQNGKIFLVMAVVCIVLIGLFIYVASIDKKIKQLKVYVNNIRLQFFSECRKKFRQSSQVHQLGDWIA